MSNRFLISTGPSRLDRVLQRELSAEQECSRSQVERLIEAGKVSVNGKVITKPAFKVDVGAVVEVALVNTPARDLIPFEFALVVLYEDEHLIVVNKPAGLTMHPGAGNREKTLANAVVHHVGVQQRGVGMSDRPGIVHRLDKDTTGVVVVAKSTPVHAQLAKQFAERSIERTYTALVFSTPRAKRPVQIAESGEVQGAIGRHPTQRTLMAITERGKPAVTEWRVLERFSYGTLLACRLQTGRTHQIRVHMNSIGCPIIGDKTYGDFSNLPRGLRDAADSFGRQALHASTLAFTHPVTGARLLFDAPLPSDFRELLEVFRAGGEGS
jgi:23S rRNA pseudouridine1911/1915/1917 synthase